MKKTLFLFVLMFMGILLSTHVVQVRGYSTTENVNAEVIYGNKKYVLKSDVTEYSQTLENIVIQEYQWFEVTEWSEENPPELEFEVAWQEEFIYSFQYSIGTTIGVSDILIPMPVIGTLSAEVTNQLTFDIGKSQSFGTRVRYKIYIDSPDKLGVWALQLVVPRAKKYLINSDWEVYTKCKWWEVWCDWKFESNYGGEAFHYEWTSYSERPRFRVYQVEKYDDPEPDPEPCIKGFCLAPAPF